MMNKNRRKLVQWTAPVIAVTMLPMHAQATTTNEPTTKPPINETTTPEPTTTPEQCFDDVTHSDTVSFVRESDTKTLSLPQLDYDGNFEVEIELEIMGDSTSFLDIEATNNDMSNYFVEHNNNFKASYSGNEVLNLDIQTLYDGSLEAYDGVTDFDGPSGDSISQNFTGRESITLSDEEFRGTGNINIDVTSSGSFNTLGSGNFILNLSTEATMRVQVTYKCL